jgi:hypothetical protein
MWHEDSLHISDDCETADTFGSALAVGDFDGDGFADVAVGVPEEDVNEFDNAGAVNVIYGSWIRLSYSGNQHWTQDSTGIIDAAKPDEWFGYALAAGDFNGDGRDDLAVGVPREAVSSQAAAGAVNVIYGSGSGLTDKGNQLWTQDSTGINGAAEYLDNFGHSLGAGDFDGDGYDDLAVGVWLEAISTITEAGAVNIIYGSPAGLSAAGNWLLHQNAPLINNDCETGDRFGDALASGDFDRDGFEDLAVGVAYEDYNGKENVGAVNVIYGSVDGLSADGDQFFHQDIMGTEDSAEEEDFFGFALAAGDFDGDHWSDLAVGVPFENGLAGAVHVFCGTSTGLSANCDLFFDQNTPGMLDFSEGCDWFGYRLAAGDFDGDHRDDLAIGVPMEDVGSMPTVSNAGAVQVVYGSDGGLDPSDNQFWHQNSPDIAGGSEEDDKFGYALAAVPKGTHRARLPLVLRNH